MSKGKEKDLPHLLTFLQDSVATRQRALCFSTSAAKATSKSSSESTPQKRLPTASALTVSEQVYSHSDTTRNRCFTCACYKCFKANHLAKNCPTKIKCHHCDAPHHPLLCKLCDGVHGSDETNTSKFNNSSFFTGENRSLGLVRRRPNKAVNVSRAPPSRDIVAPSSDSRMNSLVKGEERNDSVYTNLNVPPNYARDSGQERQDSLQHLVSPNNINVSLAERQTVSGDRTDEETEFPGFIGLITKANNTILLQMISVPLTTKSGEVEDFNILLDSGSDRSFILNSVLDKLETKHLAIEKLTYGSFGRSNVTQSGPRNLHEVNLSSSVQVQCLGVETISSKIFKPKLSSDYMSSGYIISGACFNNDSTSNMSNVTPSMLCCIASSPPTAGNGGSCRDVDDFWSLESIGVNAPVSTMTDSDTCSNKQNDSNMSIVTPSVFSMTDSGACSNNQNNLCCISSSPPTAGNGVRPYSDVHHFWLLGNRGIDSPVSSVTDSVESVIEGKSTMTDSGTCSNKQNDLNMSIVTPSVFSMTDCGAFLNKQNDLCRISPSPPTTGNGVRPYSDLHNFWLLESRGIASPVSSVTDSVESVIEGKSTMADSGTCSKKQNDSNMSIVTPSVFSMTDSGACSNNQNDLCCISSSPPTAGNGVRPYSDVHIFWLLGSRVDSPVSSVTDSVESVIEGKSTMTDSGRPLLVQINRMIHICQL